MRDWESTFASWGQPPGQTEEDERARTERRISDLVQNHPRLWDKRLRVYAKGSYRRGTNVRRGSDIDLAVELTGTQSTGDSFITAKEFEAKDLADSDLGLVDVDMGYTVVDLKQDLHEVLVEAFGSHAVERRNKCIKVQRGATDLPADVVPCRTYRRYDSRTASSDGIQIRPDRGSWIVNWPSQDDANGIAKNQRTQRRFKRAVRGLKSLENEMADNGVIQPVPSYLIECCVYNVDNYEFSSPSNYQNCLAALQHIASAVNNPALHKEWVELNELKYLFRPSQAWTVADIVRFVAAVPSYLSNR